MQTEDIPELDIRKKNVEETRAIYDAFLTEDFPLNERKPFAAIRAMMRRNRYVVYAAYLGEMLAGYAFLATETVDEGNYALLDYFAVVKELRGRGIGSVFLKKLAGEILDFDCVLIESERAQAAKSEEDRKIRERRIAFYRSCGAMHSGVHTLLYWVDYDILAFFKEKSGDTETVRWITERMYHRMYPQKWFPQLAKVMVEN